VITQIRKFAKPCLELHFKGDFLGNVTSQRKSKNAKKTERSRNNGTLENNF
jgi:hypothetical protein